MENQIIALDKNGRPIKVGDRVYWNDPDGLTIAEYEIWKVHNEEMVCLCNEYGECEALPSECEILS